MSNESSSNDQPLGSERESKAFIQNFCKMMHINIIRTNLQDSFDKHVELQYIVLTRMCVTGWGRLWLAKQIVADHYCIYYTITNLAIFQQLVLYPQNWTRIPACCKLTFPLHHHQFIGSPPKWVERSSHLNTKKVFG